MKKTNVTYNRHVPSWNGKDWTSEELALLYEVLDCKNRIAEIQQEIGARHTKAAITCKLAQLRSAIKMKDRLAEIEAKFEEARSAAKAKGS